MNDSDFLTTCSKWDFAAPVVETPFSKHQFKSKQYARRREGERIHWQLSHTLKEILALTQTTDATKLQKNISKRNRIPWSKSKNFEGANFRVSKENWEKGKEEGGGAMASQLTSIEFFSYCRHLKEKIGYHRNTIHWHLCALPLYFWRLPHHQIKPPEWRRSHFDSEDDSGSQSSKLSEEKPTTITMMMIGFWLAKLHPDGVALSWLCSKVFISWDHCM